MTPIQFPGSHLIDKPKDMTEDQCDPIHAVSGIDSDGFPYFVTAWKPSYEDLQAINRGEPIFVKTLAKQLPPMSLFTMDENNKANV